jgi:hypothetical protein
VVVASTGGTPVHAVADANGWYALPPAGLIGPEVNFLFPFQWRGRLYEIRLQMGTASTPSSRAAVFRAAPASTIRSRSTRRRSCGESWAPGRGTRSRSPCPLVHAVGRSRRCRVRREVGRVRGASLSQCLDQRRRLWKRELRRRP